MGFIISQGTYCNWRSAANGIGIILIYMIVEHQVVIEFSLNLHSLNSINITIDCARFYIEGTTSFGLY